MAFIPAANVTRVAINYISTYGERATNVFHFRDISAPTTPTRHTLLLECLTDWLESGWTTVASADWQTDVITMQDLTVEDGLVSTYPLTVSGEVNDTALPAQNTVAISWRTGLAGRSRRGRTFHVGLTEDSTSGSVISPSRLAALLTGYNYLLGAGMNQDWELVIASFVGSGEPRATALITPVTVAIIVDPIVDSMDTRKPRLA